jgi:hypothetical protein
VQAPQVIMHKLSGNDTKVERIMVKWREEAGLGEGRGRRAPAWLGWDGPLLPEPAARG